MLFFEIYSLLIATFSRATILQSKNDRRPLLLQGVVVVNILHRYSTAVRYDVSAVHLTDTNL